MWFLLVPGSGGSQPGVIVWSTRDFSGPAMVRVLGHRCSIVVWYSWSPYFRVKAAWLKIFFIWMFDNLFETTIRLPSFLWEHDHRWLAAVCSEERHDYRWLSFGKFHSEDLDRHFNDNRIHMRSLQCHSLSHVHGISIDPKSLVLGLINLLEPIDHRLTIICTGITEGNPDLLTW